MEGIHLRGCQNGNFAISSGGVVLADDDVKSSLNVERVPPFFKLHKLID